METPSSDIWQFAWKALFILTILVFSGMSVWVTIGGYKDLKTLFRRLNEANASETQESNDNSSQEPGA